VTDRPGSTTALRQSNTERVLREVRATGGAVQAELARRTGLSPATVTNLVRALTSRGLVAVEDHVFHGRKARLVTPVVAAGYVLGVDIGRSHIRVCLVDLAYRVAAEGFTRLPRGASSREGLELVAQLFAGVLADAGVERAAVRHAAVGLPGPLDQSTGHIGAATMLPEWMGQDLPARFAATLDLPVTVDNDANLGALGEFAWPPALDAQSLFYLRLATGIGGGLILDGRLYRGVDGTAGEIGHHSIDEAGPLCRCGNRGCVEAMASVPGFLRVLGSALDREVDIDTWVTLTREGHSVAVRLMEDFARHIGVAVSNIVNLVNPHRIVVGGQIAAVGETLLAPLRTEVRQRAVPAATRRLRIERARWGDYSEVYGAVHLALTAATAAPPATADTPATAVTA
jgi:predicted NBD/HSP70 family sugar kinase